MKRFVISGTAYFEYGPRLLSGIPEIAESVTAHTSVLDKKTVDGLLKTRAYDKRANNQLVVIPLEELKEETRENRPLLSLILKRIQLVDNRNSLNIILDCTTTEINEVGQILQKFQYSSLALTSNIESLSMICNDLELLDYAMISSNLFRISPLNYDEKQIGNISRHIIHQSWYYRFFAWNGMLRLIARIYQAVRSIRKR